MRSVKGSLLLLIAVVVLSPVAADAATMIIDGVDAATRGFSCGPGIQLTCSVPTGTYGSVVIGGNPVLTTNDGTDTDTMKFSGFTVRPTDTSPTNVHDIVITYSQNYSNTMGFLGGTYTYGDYMGGYFSVFPSPTGDSITLKGNALDITNLTPTTLNNLTATVGNNFFSQPASGSNSTTGFCGGSEIGCFETLTQEADLHFIGSDIVNITQSFDFIGSLVPANVNFTSDRTADTQACAAATDCNPVPEPTTLLLLGTGLAGIFALGRKRLLTGT